MTETRKAIAEVVRNRPGIHFNEIVRRLDLATGQVQYHLNRLREKDTIIDQRLYGRTHFYPPVYDEWERRALALLRRDTAGDVVAYLLANGSTRPGTVVADLEIARSTLEWHLDRLVDHGLVEKRQAGGQVSLRAADPSETVRLLRKADPALADQLVDRFMLLVDRFLTE
jgi:predicted transcriptional regulator